MSTLAGRPMEATEAGALRAGRPVRARDPVALILGDEVPRRAFYTAASVALALHLLMLAFAIAGGWLKDMRLAVDDNRARLHEFLWRQYDVDLKPQDKPKEEEKAPDPPPEPEPAPPPPPKAAAKPPEDDPYKNLPPPTPSKAGAVLTQKENPDEPVDLTKEGFVSGDGDRNNGQVAKAGTGNDPVLNTAASLKGTPGGKGTAAPAPPAAPVEDRSRAVQLAGGSSWNCPFPPESDAEQIDQATVTVQVTVRPDGSALSASVVSDPGHGFGRAARMCALTRRYQPALDKAGTAIVSSAAVNVRFSR
jgi:protein TonB